ncbi:hypothetical protein Pd630_LPD13112 (plasmid) [Rhodococcus opacus PD630]|nr:hypothetical protein Pd630_LPD13112 [Rhodococcus opacus PD630]
MCGHSEPVRLRLDAGVLRPEGFAIDTRRKVNVFAERRFRITVMSMPDQRTH